MRLFTLPGNPKLRLFLTLCTVSALLLLIAVLVSARYLYTSIPALSGNSIYEVAPGSSLSRVASDLQAQGLLDYPQLFVALARWRGVTNAVQTGEYRLEAGLTPAELLDKMVTGDNVQYRITLVEGWTFAQAMAEISRSAKLVLELQDLPRDEIAKRMELDYDNPEGMLFPDTYFYTKGATDLDLLRRANQRLREVLETAWQARLGALPYDNNYQALTMASIIEKESSSLSERGHIAGVFVRRLEQGMRLQSDPTVIYGMGEDYSGDLRRADLVLATAYNTYRINGLPPTPIALAGIDSITASLNPLPSDYLYFVAKGDGSHYFSSTLEEHNAAVDRFQRQPQTQ
ncbi:MAG TPA: endolytic transglycosylase MltG [Gammaproteobacteria bacterium]|nr:endolytic transglycosylase MltG [Gammaproteobacteria bacterium]MDP6732317.1 endolytic transglycosylase MltG [Gammaproteobacteria bacterium]HAJ75747.1 endolytic transglycosylase MltG [Gammaproteobacteria bacterium]